MLNSILLQAQGQGQFNIQGLIIPIGLVLAMYFLMIRPQQKKQKEQRKYRESIKTGDDVMTVGGIYGKVKSIEGEKVLVDVHKGTLLTLDRSSISMPSATKK